MRTIWAVIVLMLWVLCAPASAQSIVGERVVFIASGCTFTGDAGVPSGGSTCDMALNATTGDLYTKTSGGGWQKVNTYGSVVSVGLAMPSAFTVSGSPVTSSGTLTAAWASPGSNSVLYSASGTPAFSSSPVVTNLTANTSVLTPLLTTTSGDLSISPAGGTVSVPSGKVLATNYTSGWTGSGYTLNYNSSYAAQSFLELDRLSVRGTFNVYELLVHQIRATNGSIFVANTGVVKTVSGSGPYTIETETAHGFAVNDIIRAQRFTGTGVYQSDMTVTAVADTTHFTASLRATYTAPAVGMAYVRLGNTSDTSRQGSIYLTADDTNAPYINVLSGVASYTDWGTSAKTRIRMGNLNGSYGYVADTYGQCVGDPSTANICIDATNGIRIRSGTTNKMTADTSGNLNLVGDLIMGASGVIRSVSTAYGSGAAGYWLDYNGGTPRFRIGDPTGQRLAWTGSALEVVSDKLTIDANGPRITVVPTSYNTGSGYRFSTSYSGSNFVGMFVQEPTALTRDLVIYNQTTASSTQNAIYVSATSALWIARLVLLSNDAASTATLTATAITLDGEVGDIKLGANKKLTWYNDLTTLIDNDTPGRMRFTANNVRFFWDGTQLFPENNGTKNLGATVNFRWNDLYYVGQLFDESDAREKKNIKPTVYGADFIRSLKAVDYEWRRADWTPGRHTGFLAQDVARVAPSFTGISRGADGVANGLDYSAFVPPLVRAYQELDAQVQRLQAEIAALKKTIKK